MGSKRKQSDPIVTKQGVRLPQSLWTTVRASIHKFGMVKQPRFFDLFMELPRIHAIIHRLSMHDSLLDYDDDYAMKWFESDEGREWMLPEEHNLKYNRHKKMCKKYSRTKNIYEAEWQDQHLQSYANDVDPASMPSYHKFDTLRRYWSYAGRHFRNYWLLNSSLTREEAYKGAHKLAKNHLHDFNSYEALVESILSQAKAAWMIKTITKLKEHLVDLDGVTHFVDESDSMTVLQQYLETKKVEVNRSFTKNVLSVFQEWLRSKANRVESEDFAFLLNVKPTRALQDEVSARVIGGLRIAHFCRIQLDAANAKTAAIAAQAAEEDKQRGEEKKIAAAEEMAKRAEKRKAQQKDRAKKGNWTTRRTWNI